MFWSVEQCNSIVEDIYNIRNSCELGVRPDTLCGSCSRKEYIRNRETDQLWPGNRLLQRSNTATSITGKVTPSLQQPRSEAKHHQHQGVRDLSRCVPSLILSSHCSHKGLRQCVCHLWACCWVHVLIWWCFLCGSYLLCQICGSRLALVSWTVTWLMRR